MQPPLSDLLHQFIERVDLPVSRISSQAGIPRQTLFNWLAGRTPRWHPTLPADLACLATALGLNRKESDALLLAAGCVCAVDTPYFEETTMKDLKMPHGWHRAGSHPKQYEMGIDPEVRCGEKASALLRSGAKNADGFGTLMQSCNPGDFLGKRVRLSAMAQTKDIHQWAGLWFRIDGPIEGQSLQFDNMNGRPLHGTSDWERYSVVLDLPAKSTRMAFGVLLSGPGSVWIADMRIEAVSLEVPSTNLKAECKNAASNAPVNLDFKE